MNERQKEFADKVKQQLVKWHLAVSYDVGDGVDLRWKNQAITFDALDGDYVMARANGVPVLNFEPGDHVGKVAHELVQAIRDADEKGKMDVHEVLYMLLKRSGVWEWHVVKVIGRNQRNHCFLFPDVDEFYFMQNHLVAENIGFKFDVDAAWEHSKGQFIVGTRPDAVSDAVVGMLEKEIEEANRVVAECKKSIDFLVGRKPCNGCFDIFCECNTVEDDGEGNE